MSPGVLANVAEPLPVVPGAKELRPQSLFMYNDIAVLCSRFLGTWHFGVHCPPFFPPRLTRTAAQISQTGKYGTYGHTSWKLENLVPENQRNLCFVGLSYLIVTYWNKSQNSRFTAIVNAGTTGSAWLSNMSCT